MTMVQRTFPPTDASVDASTWVPVCPIRALTPDFGSAVLLNIHTQIALFSLSDGSLYAVGNVDPFSGAAVISRGIVGDHNNEPTVASPLLKQVFSLYDGHCLTDEQVQLPVYETRVIDGYVYLRDTTVAVPTVQA